MSSGPDLFVVCKSCGSEVSPYVTECPYCGTRLRKRAPKLDRGGIARPDRPQRHRPSLSRLRPGEIPGIRADRRPYATIALVLASVVVTLGARIGLWGFEQLWYPVASTDELWRLATAPFIYLSTGYEVFALATVFFFGRLLERRHGLWAPVLVFLVGGAGGFYLAHLVGETDIAMGANGAALAMVAAWAMRDVLGRRRGREDSSDLLGALAVAAAMICVPLVVSDASAPAGVAGGIIGLVLGLGLAQLPEG
jgi:membrane associated rhomboid family serine protease